MQVIQIDLKKKHMRLKFFLFTISAIFLISSCTSYKKIPYYQDLKQDSIVTETINNYSPLTIQVNDLIGMHVTSLNHEADGIFNYNLERPNSVGNTVSTGEITRTEQNSIVGYRVDRNGNIYLPTLGSLKIGGLTLIQAKAAIENKLSEILKSPTVELRLQNFRISILGDVKNPGLFSVTDEKITINEALALAGDLNTTGIRNNIFLVREADGQRQYIPIDLTSKKVFTSQYYYLKNNDVIYVTPNRDRALATDSYFQKLSLLLSALTIVVVYLSR